MTLILGLVPAAAAQQPRYSSDWDKKGSEAQSIDPADEKLQRLTDELNALIDDAERARAADPRFLSDLRDLARRYAWPWTVRIVSDDFSDGDVSRNPAWSVWGADLRVHRRRGVTMRVAAPAQTEPPKPVDQKSDADLPGAVFKTLLGQLARPEQRSGETQSPATPEPETESGMKLAAAVPNAFAIPLNLQSATQGTGRFEVGVTQGNANSGYRLAYNTGGRPALELIRVTRRGSAVIDSVAGPLSLEDGKRHLIQLTRDAVGDMAIEVDGKELIRTRDRGFRDPFDGVLLLDRAGEYRIRSIAVYGSK